MFPNHFLKHLSDWHYFEAQESLRWAFYLLVHFQPCHSVFDVIPQTKKPGLPESQCPAHKFKQILSFPLQLPKQDYKKG